MEKVPVCTVASGGTPYFAPETEVDLAKRHYFLTSIRRIVSTSNCSIPLFSLIAYQLLLKLSGFERLMVTRHVPTHSACKANQPRIRLLKGIAGRVVPMIGSPNDPLVQASWIRGRT